ncbi:MAG: N-acetylmuramyl-L-alanine amidase, negative regulator of AmpC, AmpD [Candidatus Angelobacter sp.]|nr:N-acetylmuramyl-L-alanine amidase, negative regulator of AmpC, AmpD [Candidatus Angelobacter sp.]
MQRTFVGCAAVNFRLGRPSGFQPEAIVIHIGEGSLRSIDMQFSDPNARVSAHYCVSKAGDIHQYVDEKDTAFHAGTIDQPTWSGLKPGRGSGSFINPNFYTIGIEHEGFADDQWPDAQLSTSAALVGEIAQRWKIPLDEDHVIRHHQIRFLKSCPGRVIAIADILGRIPPAAPVVPPGVTSVKTINNLRLRGGAPSLGAPVVRTIPAQTVVEVSTVFLGDTVNGNNKWYSDGGGNFLWAGGTDQP